MKRGFTLIELIITVSIIAILLAITLMGMDRVKDVAATSQTRGTLQVCEAVTTELAAKGLDTVFIFEGVDFAEGFLNLAKSNTVTSKMIQTQPVIDNQLVDGWGNPIYYDYTRQVFGSAGPDGVPLNDDDLYSDELE